MTSVERAKRFLQGRAKRLALAAVPLAIAAAGVTTAHAGAILYSGGKISVLASGASGSGIYPGTPSGGGGSFNFDPGTGLTGVSLHGEANVSASGSGTDTLSWIYAGTAFGTPGVTSVPADWYFTLYSDDASASLSWDLEIDFNGTDAVNSFTGSGLSGCTDFGCGVSSPANTFVTLPLESLSSYTVTLTATYDHPDSFGGEDVINIPLPPTIDIDSADAPSAPEPASWMLMFTGAGVVLWKRRRRKPAA